MSQLFVEKGSRPLLPYDFTNIAIAPTSRAVLNDRITKRFDQMLRDGLVEEAQQLLIFNSMPRVVGYWQVYQYLYQELSYEAMREKAIIATRQLAKRQMTWLHNWPNILWFDSNKDNISKQILQVLPF